MDVTFLPQPEAWKGKHVARSGRLYMNGSWSIPVNVLRLLRLRDLRWDVYHSLSHGSRTNVKHPCRRGAAGTASSRGCADACLGCKTTQPIPQCPNCQSSSPCRSFDRWQQRRNFTCGQRPWAACTSDVVQGHGKPGAEISTGLDRSWRGVTGVSSTACQRHHY